MELFVQIAERPANETDDQNTHNCTTLRTVPILFRSLWVHQVVWWRAIRNSEIDQVITGNSVPDLLYRKHCLAVTEMILNEHEHVDKQIFEILERDQVREKSRRLIEQQFASKKHS
jgi:hypothetical protein